MPIHTSAARLQAYCRPSLFSRTLQRVPPRTRPRFQIQRLLLPQQAANHHKMSSTSYPAAAAPAGSSPASGSSTSPRPGNAPSATNAAAAAASGGAAPAPAAATTVETTESQSQSQSQSQTPSQKPLALPPAPDNPNPNPNNPSDKTTTISVNGAPVALDALGPMVIGRDGSVSRIANWHEMVEHEKQATLRVLGKRNQLRLGALREAMDTNSKPEGESSS